MTHRSRPAAATPDPRTFRPTQDNVNTRGGRAFDVPPIYDVVEISGLDLSRTGGIFIQAAPGMTIAVRNNTVEEIVRGPGMEYAQFVQVSGLAGDNLPAVPCVIQLEISGNVVSNTRGVADVEDVISLIGVQGTRDRPLIVDDNRLTGAYPLTPRDGYSGSLIMLDRGVWWAAVTRNRCTESDNVGIGVAGGCYNVVQGNVVRAVRGGNVGIYCANQYKGDPFIGNRVGSNIVQWYKPDGTRNDVWVE
jgi:hypothetical protein